MKKPRHNEEERELNGVTSILRHNVRLDRIEYMPTAKLSVYGRKLRTRSDAGAAALKNSIASFGIVLPILIDQSNTVVGGEGIVEAARSLGFTEVPTVRVEHLDEGEIRLLRIALNKLGETSDWSRVELAAEFSELLSIDTTLHYEVTGFSTIGHCQTKCTCW